jgi:hypothetical protein
MGFAEAVVWCQAPARNAFQRSVDDRVEVDVTDELADFSMLSILVFNRWVSAAIASRAEITLAISP